MRMSYWSSDVAPPIWRCCTTSRSTRSNKASCGIVQPSLVEQPVHRLGQRERQALAMYPVAFIVDTAQIEIEHATDVGRVVVAGQARAQLAMQGQRVDRVLQVVAAVQHGITHGFRGVGRRVVAEPGGILEIGRASCGERGGKYV